MITNQLDSCSFKSIGEAIFYFFMTIKTIFAAVHLLAFANLSCEAAEPLVLNPDDHISLIGNALADRMQHDGWLETLLQVSSRTETSPSAISVSPATN